MKWFERHLFSEGAYGVVEAADVYFSKKLEELTVEDVALLAGIPQRPNYFNPFKNPDEAEKRRNIVITLMERTGKSQLLKPKTLKLYLLLTN
ncbi:transglycosylase domain-containing protein [Anaerobacillus sp. HL2]|nr:transglycosylase domain-containing protein [Anaerobacillus sp. HL2]